MGDSLHVSSSNRRPRTNVFLLHSVQKYVNSPYENGIVTSCQVLVARTHPHTSQVDATSVYRLKIQFHPKFAKAPRSTQLSSTLGNQFIPNSPFRLNFCGLIFASTKFPSPGGSVLYGASPVCRLNFFGQLNLPSDRSISSERSASVFRLQWRVGRSEGSSQAESRNRHRVYGAWTGVTESEADARRPRKEAPTYVFVHIYICIYIYIKHIYVYIYIYV